jgi:hypothetical protein
LPLERCTGSRSLLKDMGRSREDRSFEMMRQRMEMETPR